MCIAIARQLRGHYDSVVIITPYQAQARHILSKKSGVVVHTVDSFQGREADAIVLSVVRPGAFWTRERLTVARTRARHAMRVVGNARCDAAHGTDIAALYEDAERRCVMV